MPTFPHPLAIQSWCYRHFRPLTDLIRELKASGVSATELCGWHTEFNDPAAHAPAIATFKAAGITITSIGVETLKGDVALDRPKFDFCRAANVKTMAITFSPDLYYAGYLKQAEALADAYDVRLAIHNHGGYDWLGNSVILRHVFAHTSPRIGLHLDTAWALDAKQDPIKMADEFKARLYGVHIKDFTFDRARAPKDVVIGTGNLNLPELISTLKTNAFAGPLVIEYEGDVENPVPALKQCVEVLSKLL
jgi:sugar phosphate isomerase/epimerase